MKAAARRRTHSIVIAAILSMVVALAAVQRPAIAQEKPDFISPAEAEKVRDAQTPTDRAKLFLDFAADRLKKLDYELQLKTPQMHKTEILNGLLNSYSQCMDKASDRIEEGRERGADVRKALKQMQKNGEENLAALKKIEAANSPDLSAYKDSLNDAIEETQDALSAASKAAKQQGAIPVRRKP